MFLFDKLKNTSTKMSLPKAKTIHGVEVKKVPIGRYLAAMDDIKDLPSKIITDLFPGLSMKEIYAKFANINEDGVTEIVGRLFVVCPRHVIDLLSTLLDIDKNKILNELTPAELTAIVKEFWAMNDMTDFFKDVSVLLKKMLPTLTNGSKSGLQ